MIGFVWSFVIVKPKPLSCIVLYIFYGIKQKLTRPTVTYRLVVPLNISVLLRLTRLDVLNPDLVVFGPVNEFNTDEFRPVITSNNGWLGPFAFFLLSLHHNLANLSPPTPA